MENNIIRLKAAKKKLEAAEKERIILDTKMGGLIDRLHDLGYKSVKEALSAIDDMESEISDLEDTLGEMIHDFETKYTELVGNES